MLQKALLFCMVLTIGFIGCKKDEKKDSLPTEVKKEINQAVKDNAPQVPAGATAPTPTAATKRTDCEKLLSSSLRDKYFKGFSMKQEPMCAGCPEQCKLLEKPTSPIGPSVIADCRWNNSPTWFEEASKTMEQQKSWQKVEGLGRISFKVMDMQVIFIPQKYNCVITITWMGGGDKLLTIGKEIEADLSPEALGI
jgi:hypothetical protein